MLLVLAGCLLLSGCSTAAAAPPLKIRDVAAPKPTDPGAPCSREAAAGPADTTPATGRGATFDRATNTLLLTAGDVTLPALSRAVANPAILRETAPGEWLLGAKIQIAKGASLKVVAPSVRWLRMSSDTRGFSAITAAGGGLDINGTCVTSWDTDKRLVDDTYGEDGRAFLLARDGGQMTIDHAELRYLGSGQGESYGVSWRLEGTGGKLTNSIVSELYFGIYTYEVGGLVITDNEVYNSVLYGIDPHSRSHDLKIERNIVHDNGKHGIILAEECTNSVIRDNIVYRNRYHGIVIYLRSDSNVVENNESFGNQVEGINVNESSQNTVRGNRVYQNVESGIGIGQSALNTVVDQNEVRANQQDGIKLFSGATQTTVSKNMIGENGRSGIYVDTDAPFSLAANTIFGSRVGILLKGAAPVGKGDNQMSGNTEDIRNG